MEEKEGKEKRVKDGIVGREGWRAKRSKIKERVKKGGVIVFLF